MEKYLIEEHEYSDDFLQLLIRFEKNDSDDEDFLAMSKWVEDNEDNAEPDWDIYEKIVYELVWGVKKLTEEEMELVTSRIIRLEEETDDYEDYELERPDGTVNTMRLNRNWALYKKWGKPL